MMGIARLGLVAAATLLALAIGAAVFVGYILTRLISRKRMPTHRSGMWWRSCSACRG
jgi:hypothetical protein